MYIYVYIDNLKHSMLILVFYQSYYLRLFIYVIYFSVLPIFSSKWVGRNHLYLRAH